MDNYWNTMVSKENHIYPKGYWENGALTNPEDCILSKYSKEKFWNEEVKIEGLNKDTIFLDIGCGIGRIAKWVAPLVKEYYGVDFSTEMIKKANEIYQNADERTDFFSPPNVYFNVNNGIDLSLFGDEKFDVVYICLVFQHMQRELILNYIKEVHRVLKEGGIFFAKNIPKIESYTNGLTKEEVNEVMKPFTILDLNESGVYYEVKCRK